MHVRKEAMKHSLNALVLGLLVWSMLPHAVLAVQPDVSTDAKRKAQATPVDINCVQVPDRYQTTGPFTAKELEADASFDKASAQWKEFLRELRRGDKLLKYDEGCCTGIIIVRKGCIVDWFQISES